MNFDMGACLHLTSYIFPNASYLDESFLGENNNIAKTYK